MLVPPILLPYIDSLPVGAVADCVLVPVEVLVACAVLGLGDPVSTKIATRFVCILMCRAPRANQVHCRQSAPYSVALLSPLTCAPLPIAVISDLECCCWPLAGYAGATNIPVYSSIEDAVPLIFYKTVLICVGGDVQCVHLRYCPGQMQENLGSQHRNEFESKYDSASRRP